MLRKALGNDFGRRGFLYRVGIPWTFPFSSRQREQPCTEVAIPSPHLTTLEAEPESKVQPCIWFLWLIPESVYRCECLAIFVHTLSSPALALPRRRKKSITLLAAPLEPA